jgi:hypothetical protein
MDLSSQLVAGGGSAVQSLAEQLGAVALFLIPFTVGYVIFRKIVIAVSS